MSSQSAGPTDTPDEFAVGSLVEFAPGVGFGIGLIQAASHDSSQASRFHIELSVGEFATMSIEKPLGSLKRFESQRRVDTCE